jgi:hypothetical protein
MWLTIAFIIAFIAGFSSVYFMDFTNETDIIIFESQEELDRMCWEGLGDQRFKR